MKAGGTLSLLIAAVLCLALLAQGVTEEVPLGAVQGVVTMSENGRPIPGATVMFRPVWEAEYTRIRSATVGEDGAFAIRNMPAGDYVVEAYAKAHSLQGSRVTIGEGKPTALQLELRPHPPHLDIYASQRVFTPDEDAQFEAHGFAEDDAIQVEVFSLDTDKVARQGGIDEAVSTLAYPGSNEPDPLQRLGTKVATFSQAITRRDGEGVFIEYVKVPRLPEGLYWLRCAAGPAQRATFLNITRLAMVSKEAGSEILCFATDIATGAPVPGVEVSYLEKEGLVPGGTTGEDGTVRFAKKPGTEYRTTLLGVRGASRAVVGFYTAGDHGANGVRAFIYTDRPVYRPGDTVQFKGIVRRLEAYRYALPGNATAHVVIRDPDQTQIKSFDAPLDAAGTFHGEFALSRESRPGSAAIEVEIDGAKRTEWVSVSAYRKPEFTVSVKPERQHYVRGETARMKIACRYYHGGPVVGAAVTATISSRPTWLIAPMDLDEDSGSYSEGYGAGEYLQDVEVTTDERGEAVVAFPTRRDGDPRTLESDESYTVHAYVEDAGGKYFDGEGSVLVTRGEFALGISLDRYVVSGSTPVEATVTAISHEGSKPVAGLDVRVLVGREEWNGSESRFLEESRQSLRTGPDGKARLRLTATRSGGTVFKVIATDSKGNEVTESEYVWVDGPGGATTAPAPKGNVSIRLDRAKYKVGDTAKVLVQTSEPGGTAWLTVEGERVYASKLVPLAKGSAVVDLPVAEPFAPNAFVTVSYVHGKQFMEASRRLEVAQEARSLKLKVQPDREIVEPGDTVLYTIHASDEAGRPVAADLSLGVVDEAIYAIAEDSTDIVEGFYPRRNNSVSTGYSFPEVYLDGGDKAPGDVKVRTLFLDTAYWNPSVTTDSSGVATVSVKLPDNITQWRATVVGATSETAVGMADAKLRARKPLMVRLEAPEFLVQRDRRTITAVLTNDSGASADVHVEIEATGLSLGGDARRTVKIANGREATVSWTLTPGPSGEGSATAKAWIDGGPSDGVRKTIPIKPFGRTVTEGTAGDFEGSTELRFNVRPGADPGSGRAVLVLSPSLARTMLSGLDELIDYPYGCVEQTMSRFMPALVVSEAVKRLNLPEPPRLKDLPAIAADSLARLSNMRHYDGAWGWWEHDETDPGMTAYVLEGLHRAESAGFETRDLALGGLEWAVRCFKDGKSKTWSRRDRLALLYALALNGRRDFVLSKLPEENLNGAGAGELAIAAQLLRVLGDKASEETVLDRLARSAEVGGAYASWTESGYGHEDTARALEALAVARPADPLLPKVVRRLLQQRRGGGWVSTRDTAHILLALAAYLPTTGELQSSGSVEILLNGQPYKRVALSANSPVDPSITMPLGDLKSGANVVTLRRAGGGRCYYTFEARQTVAMPHLGKLVNDSGLEVSRRYLKLEPRRMEDGTLRLGTGERPVDAVRSGTVLMVELTVRSTAQQEYVLIEDPIPSGFRILDRGYEDPWDWNWWYTESDAYDDRMVFFARTLPPGANVLKYTIRAENVGLAHALPTRVFDMYRPQVHGSSAETVIEVSR